MAVVSRTPDNLAYGTSWRWVELSHFVVFVTDATACYSGVLQQLASNAAIELAALQQRPVPVADAVR